jgi:hypothetical protein
MVVHDFDVIRIAIAPDEAEPPLVVDPDAVLSDPIAREGFQVVAWWLPEILEPDRRGQRPELATRHFGQIVWKALRPAIRPDRRRPFVGERLGHNELRSA